MYSRKNGYNLLTDIKTSNNPSRMYYIHREDGAMPSLLLRTSVNRLAQGQLIRVRNACGP
jgi:hypothetical protein